MEAVCHRHLVIDMTTQFTWHIANLERETIDGYVYRVHYTIDAFDGVYRANAYGSLDLDRADEMVPFADLSEALVVQWVKDKLNHEKVAEIEARLQSQLDQQRAPTKAQGVPWAS